MPDLLFLSHRIPYPPNKGDKIRAWHMLEHLARRWRVHLGCFYDDPADAVHITALEAVCASVCCVPLDPRRGKRAALLRLRPGRPLTLDYFGNTRLRRWVDATLAGGGVTASFVFSAGVAEYVIDRPGLLRILDMVDVDSEKFAEYARRTRFPARLVWAREGRTLLAFESRAALAFDHTLLVSPAECARFEALAPAVRGRVTPLENGVDVNFFSPQHCFARPYDVPGDHLVFTGTMDYWPNMDAMIWFVREVMPRLRQRPNPPRLAIVGASPAPEIRALARPDVLVTGRVDDVRPYLAHAAVAIAPLRLARGIQNKVLEAMAMGRPVVASPEAFEGIRAAAGTELLVSDGAAAMAEAVGSVLDGRYQAMGTAARAAMVGSYGWAKMLGRLDTLLEQCGASVATAREESA